MLEKSFPDREAFSRAFVQWVSERPSTAEDNLFTDNDGQLCLNTNWYEWKDGSIHAEPELASEEDRLPALTHNDDDEDQWVPSKFAP